MKKVVIIGAGFAGLAAASRLSRSGLKIEVTLFDKKSSCDFLPVLPDCIGRGIDSGFLSYDLATAAENTGFSFINEEVLSVDLKNQKVFTGSRDVVYDFLIISSGSETNFYGNDNIRKCACKLDDSADASGIVEKLRQGQYQNHIICGGGYTGVETATNIRRFLSKNRRFGKVLIVERGPSILGPLPEWMKNYVSDNLKRLDIEVIVNSQIERAEENAVYISGGKVYENTFLVWAAGVKTSDFVQGLKVSKNPQGRIKVDEYLRLDEHCFAAGDAAYFLYKNNYLRMAIQFAIYQGDLAAVNVLACIRGINLYKYRPVDMGYIIPMANNLACGVIMGMNLKGFLPTAAHFFMCLYRLKGWKNKIGLLRGLLDPK